MKITDRKIEDVEASRRKYNFDQLQIDQCLELTISNKGEERMLRSAASHYAANHSITLSVKKIGIGGFDAATGILFGVWRTA